MVFGAFVRAAAAMAARAMPRRRVLPRPGSGITISRDPTSARPRYRPRDETDVVKEEDASTVSDVVAGNLRHKVPCIRLSARHDLISERLPLRLEELPIHIEPNAIPVIGKIVEQYLDAAAVVLRDSITEEFKKHQVARPSIFTYVASRMAFLADLLSTAGSLLVLGICVYYLCFPDKFRAHLDALNQQMVNSIWYAITHGYFGETIVQRHERMVDEIKAAEDLKRRKELEDLVNRCLEERRRPAPRRLTVYEMVLHGLTDARGQGDGASRWDHSYKGMASVGKKEWLKSQR